MWLMINGTFFTFGADGSVSSAATQVINININSHHCHDLAAQSTDLDIATKHIFVTHALN